MKSNYDLIVLSLSGAEKFSHIIKENQRLTEQGGSTINYNLV